MQQPGCGRWETRSVPAMGSRAEVVVGDPPAGALAWAVDELERLEQCWSRFRPDSELSALNASAGGWQRVSPLLGAAVHRALVLRRLTGGLFDPTVHAHLVRLGYDRTFRELTPATVDRCRVAGHASAPARARDRATSDTAAAVVRLASGARAVFLPDGAALDLGGVGKGLAADLVARGLVARGARSACVAVGGDVRVHGVPPDERGWSIPLAHPLTPDQLWGTVNLRDGAIVTSTTLLRRWVHDGRVAHHLIDPRTGEPAASGVSTVVCTASEAWFAEGVAKAALVAGPSAGRWLLDTSGVGGVLACDDGTIVAGAWWPAIHAVAAAGAGHA